MRSWEFGPSISAESQTHLENVANLFQELEISQNKYNFLDNLASIEGIAEDDRHALLQSIRGDRRLVDERLRDPSVKLKYWIVEIPKELGLQQNYAWTVAEHDQRMLALQRSANSMYINARNDDILRCPDDYRADCPPAINWILPVRSSRMPQPPSRDAARDEFYIFQTPKGSSDEYIDDFEQSLVLNSELVERGLEIQKNRMREVFNTRDEYTSNLIEFHSQNSFQLAATHLELHNSGHFLGPIPFGDSKRDHRSYDFIEELRACLCSFRTAEVNGLKGLELEALGLQILASRVMLHGYNAWNIENGKRNRQEVREIVVGAILWQNLLDRKLLTIEDGLITLTPGCFKKCIPELLCEIHAIEKTCIDYPEEEIYRKLDDYAVGMLMKAFNGKEYRPELIELYNRINKI